MPTVWLQRNVVWGNGVQKPHKKMLLIKRNTNLGLDFGFEQSNLPYYTSEVKKLENIKLIHLNPFSAPGGHIEYFQKFKMESIWLVYILLMVLGAFQGTPEWFMVWDMPYYNKN